MSDRDSRLLHQCWANALNNTNTLSRCHNRVPADPDHIGLCDPCLAHKRGDTREAAA